MKESIFKRKIYSRMLDWKRQSNGTSALLVEGARRIGKSTIVEEFARNEYATYIIIDFSDVKSEILNLFDNIADRDFFFLRLQVLTGRQLITRESVIVFDEVQLCPKARQAIKHLVKDGRYDYIETGSLLSIKKNVKDILIPSEEHRISMHPMDFEEFLWAVGKPMYYDLIRKSYEDMTPFGDSTHRALMREFRLYMLVGGMPQAVEAYLKYNDFSKVDNIKRDIIRLYTDDFRKIDISGKVSAIFSSVPSQLSRNVLRYKIGSVIPNARPSRTEGIFAELEDSKTVNFAHHANDPGVGFALHADYDFFKIFLADTGLFITLAFMDKDFTDNEIYRKLLSDKLSADLGYVYENAVAQMLRSAGHSLYYYTFKEYTENSDEPRVYEIDFLISRKDKICPIEVKSSGYKSHKSLDEFQKKFSSRIKERYLLYTKDMRKEQDIICLPVYMAGLL
ncbi:MAG: AAA family ATPase [Clostridium sp.]|nr:AAA family ATPase [Bacteroides sp.]MCM1198683.1 AAA family ATPase [Clostridium sp.]